MEGGGGLNLLGDEFNLKHEIVVVNEISHKSSLLTTNKQTNKQTNKTNKHFIIRSDNIRYI